MTQINNTPAGYDRLGIIFSIACILHCMALPVLSLFTPTITVFLEQEWIHFLLLVLVIPIALSSFMKGHKLNQSKIPLALGLTGVTFLLTAIFSHELEKIFTVCGSILLVIAHLHNLKLKKR